MYGFVVLMTLTLSACGLCDEREVSRTPSPDGAREVVVMDRRCGVTTSFNYAVHLVGSGGAPKRSNQVAWLHGAVLNPDSAGVHAEWTGAHSIVLQYLRARDTGQFRDVLGKADSSLTLRFVPGVLDSSAARQRP